MDNKQAKQQGRLVRSLIPLNGAILTFLVGDTLLLALLIVMQNIVTLMNAQNVIQNTVLTGKTATKRVNALLMGIKGFLIAQLIMQYAVSIGNDDLKNAASFSLDDLCNASEADLIARNNIIHGLAVTYVTAMIAAGLRILATDVTGYGTLISNYQTSAPSWTSAKSLRVAAGASQLASYNQIVYDIVPSLKRLMRPYNGVVASQAFYDAVTNAIKTGTITVKVLWMELKYVDGVTGGRLTGVDCSLTLNDRTTTKMCSKRGRIPWYGLSNGNGYINSAKPGYISVNEDGLDIQEGQILRKTITMNKVPPMSAKSGKKIISQVAKTSSGKSKKVRIPKQGVGEDAAKIAEVKIPEVKKEAGVKKKK
jgi:hypothetical protein